MVQRQHQKLLLFGGLLSLSLFPLFFNIYNAVPATNKRALVNYSAEERKFNDTRTILLWTTFFSDTKWTLPKETMGPDDFRDLLHCPVYQCELSNNHSFLPSVDMYDAVVIHTNKPHMYKPLPAKRSPHQFYVFGLLESPGYMAPLETERELYNLTMTYRLDSDIVWPYNRIEDIETGAFVAPVRHPTWRQPPTEFNHTSFLHIWSNKTKDVAWFVSNCNAISRRDQLVKSLQKFINIDIFGKCGKLKCERGKATCDQMLDEKYKFYLAFENSLCTDYVTEKFFNNLQRLIVPVVFGGANYTRFAPPYSYINAEDFNSTAALGAYLKELATNPAKYFRYFWWRRYYRAGCSAVCSPFCALCERLHESKRHTYSNMQLWWFDGMCRVDAKIKF